MRNETHLTHIMVPDPITVDVKQPFSDVRRALSSERFHHLPVVDRGKLVGLISSTDVLKLGLGKDDLEDGAFLDAHFTVADVMQKDVITVSHRATVEEAARKLSAGGFHALPVVDEDQHLRGLITSTDLITFMLDEPPPPEAPAGLLERLKLLERVLKTAEMYLHSGLAGAEHARLEKAIQAARRG